ncbi:MAG: DNA polymerase III subunit epsilon [Coxiella sp. RIFCSPHIGHO2_12_FULL_42_15]|nr:MAG: DNA polymerase III subunit epsilon [Coxiella sp. RIFCSPHIGHO2_12_FULL_42_15]
MRNIILDTETTGLDPKQGHRIIEIGCVEMIDRRLTGNNLHFYINPERSIDSGARQVHGITEQFLQDKPTFSQIALQLMDYLRGGELIIHNAPFDVGFLDHEFKLLGKPFQPLLQICTVIDTLALARRKHPGQQNSLDALCRRYHVDNSNRALHGALLDAELLAHVYLFMTGGQTQLFEMENENKTLQRPMQERQQSVSHERYDLRIIHPSDDELRAHQQFLQMMQKKGACCWEEEPISGNG